MENLISECDLLLKNSRASEVVKRLRKISMSEVERKWQLPLARLARRSGAPSWGLRLLTKFILNEKHPYPAELAEYAILQQRCGAAKPALAILQAIDPAALPEVYLYRAYCQFNLWDYEHAIPNLTAYLQKQISPYERLVGKVNLASALLFVGNIHEAETLLLESLDFAREHSYKRLYGNCLELLGQIYIRQRDFPAARTTLNLAADVFGSDLVHDQLFVRKWQAVLDGISGRNLRPLKIFRAEALRRNEPEAVRDIDFHSLDIEFDQQLFDRLFYGTSSGKYRERLLQKFKSHQPSPQYIFGAVDAPCLDLASGQIDGRDELPVGTKIHQFIELVVRDFYRPLRVGEIFSELFPGDHFDIFSSPHRVREILYRTRTWFKSKNLELEFKIKSGGYLLSPTKSFSIRKVKDSTVLPMHALRIAQIREHFSDQSFSAAQGIQVLKMSRAEFKRFASQALASGELERYGAARSTVYFLKNVA